MSKCLGDLSKLMKDIRKDSEDSKIDIEELENSLNSLLGKSQMRIAEIARPDDIAPSNDRVDNLNDC